MIFKKKRFCYLTGKTNKLTFHHILPQREIYNDYPENIMILNREIHDIIDMPKCLRTEKVYLKFKKEIDKYNKFLIKHNFPERLLWKIREIKPHKRNLNKNSIIKNQTKKYMEIKRNLKCQK